MGRKDMTLRQGYEAIKKRLEAGCDSPPLTLSCLLRISVVPGRKPCRTRETGC